LTFIFVKPLTGRAAAFEPIVVLNWNGVADTAACLESLRSVRVPESVAAAGIELLLAFGAEAEPHLRLPTTNRGR
jgi:hypothetical protein